MTHKELSAEVEIPAGVSASVVKGVVTVKGPKGEVVRDMFDYVVSISVKGNSVHLHSALGSRKQKRVFFTYESHLVNMVKGVQNGFEYVLKVCSGHFPMNVSVVKGQFIVKNFFGEKIPRVLDLTSDVDVKVEGDVVRVKGVDLNRVSTTAAAIELLCRRAGFDRRVFQDGIYIITKDGEPV